MLSLQEIITATGGHCENMQELIFTGITTDSRIESSGELFVALCGERFDGHAYCKMALEQERRQCWCQSLCLNCPLKL